MTGSINARLQIAAVVFMLFGVVIAAAAVPALGGPLGLMGDLIFFPLDGQPGAPGAPTERLLAAICGGLMAGWGAMLFALGRGASIARATLTGALVWFGVDSLGSILAGGALNAASNTAFLALLVWAVLPGLGRAGGMTAAGAGR